MKIRQILESVSAGGMGTGSIATAPAKAGKMIKREKGNLLAQEEQNVAEVGLGDYRKKAAMQKAQSQMGAMFGKDPEQRAKDLATFQKREKGLNRVKARDEKARAADQQKQLADLVARLPELEAEYAAMQKRYKALGGSDWQYADREQNLTPAEREARGMEGTMSNLWRQIQAAKKSQGVAEGDKHSMLGKIQRGHELKKKVDTSFADIGKAQKAGDHTAASKAFRKHERYANLERPGTWTKVDEQGVAEGDLEENKKGVRAVKHTTKAKGIEAPKPRNFVAKNAIQGGAGAHKDKKKAAKQGDVKHKAKELTYESQLWSALERKIGK